MTLGRKDFSVSRTDGGANVFRLAGFLRDDDLIDHDWLGWKDRFDAAELEHIANTMASQGTAPELAPRSTRGGWFFEARFLREHPTHQCGCTDGGVRPTVTN